MSDRWRKYLHDARTFPADAAVAWRRERWRGLWETVAQRTLFRVYRSGRLTVYAQPVAAALEVPPPDGVRIAPLSSDDLPALAELVGVLGLERFRTLLACGHRAVVAWRGDRPVGYAWVALTMGKEVSHCDLPLPADAAYLWDLYVIPEERSHGVGTALASGRLRVARECGRREGWRMIERENRPSIRTLMKSNSGTRVVAEVSFLKILTRMRSRYRPLSTEAG
jgi:GNAT superfamily N-acetyltransferase